MPPGKPLAIAHKSCWALPGQGPALPMIPASASLAPASVVAPAPALPGASTSGQITVRPSLSVATEHRQSDSSTTRVSAYTTSAHPSSVPPNRPSLVVVLRYTPPRPPSPATIAHYYPYPPPRRSYWSAHNAYGPPVRPGEDNPATYRSRATRNQDAVTRSRQGQVIDLDPTDGLPVQKYALMKVTLNQDASSDPTTTNTKSTNSAEWAAQFNTPHFPWSEPPVPSFQKELPIWNQELIRRARAGNTNAKLSVWDRKNNCWMSAAEAEKKATPLKSLHLNNLEASTDTNGKLANGDAESTKSDAESDAADSSNDNDSNKSADEDEEDADEGAPFKTSSTKRRKLANRLNGPDETRLIEVKKWVQLPSTIADRTPDRNFLATRRPGMPPLYNPEYAQRMFGQYHSSSSLGGTAGYDLGEGGGLSSATGAIGGSAADAGASTPQRKNIPPRRKKKKLGGPGRKPKNWHANQAAAAAAAAAQADGASDVKTQGTGDGAAADGGAMEGVQVTGDAGAEAAVKTEGEAEGEAEGDDNNESGSEAEGSEEGEIDETGGAEKTQEQNTPDPAAKQDPASTRNAMQGADTARPALDAQSDAPTTSTTTTPAVAAPEVTITDTEMKESEAEPIPEPEQHRAPISAIMNTTSNTPRAAAPTTSVEHTIPGLGAEKPADAEEQQIIQENAEAITTTADPTQEQIGGVSEALTTAAEIPREEHEGVHKEKEDVSRQAAGKVEEAGGEGAGEVDLLGAMDEAIDRGMSEGRDA
ncbi:hypothetical protein PMZ80_009892 [Knufia obscura]|uniref:Uncharacterized protein n=1 Tax=Knufia obscura TaxID=1635080 RepID=A0ABR0RC42_9EURO|nr:hypothetical protein PMZ80_009892 [Knufia obscura]